ncbi:MAG: hypothetical protein DDT34_01874 [Firmicutes bacterium]|nr:hypothetical protein [Bacillota bacterium]
MPPDTTDGDMGVFFNLLEENFYWLDDISVKVVPPVDGGAPIVGNQVPNSSFEVGATKWSATIYPAGDISEDEAHEITANAALLSIPADNAPHGKRVLQIENFYRCAVFLTSAYFPLRHGIPASIGFWMKAPAGKYVELYLNNEKTPAVTQRQKMFTARSSEWEFYSMSVTPKLSSSKTYYVRLHLHNPGVYLFDSVTAVEGEEALKTAKPNPINIGFEPTGRPANVFFKNEPMTPILLVEAKPQLSSQTLHARVLDAWNKEIKRFSIEIPLADGRGEKKITLPTGLYGGFKCEIAVTDDFAALPLAEIVYAVVPKLPSPKDGSRDLFFGGHTRFTPYNLALAELMGLRSLRMHPPVTTKWKIIARFGHVLDGVRRAHRMGFNLLSLFDSVPAEFADRPENEPKDKHPHWWSSYPPKDPEPWKQYVKDTYKVFGPYIDEWEVWNEPDSPFLLVKPGLDKATEYVRIVRLTREALDEIGAEVTLIGGGIANPAKPFLQSAFEQGMGRYIDVVSFHFYFESSSPDEVPLPTMVEQIQKLRTMPGRGGKPLDVWHTEGGASLSDGAHWSRSLRIPATSYVSTFEAATTLVRTIASLKAAGARRHYHYSAFAEPMGRQVNRDETSVMFEASGAATPSFAAHAASVLMLEGAEGKGVRVEQIGASRVVIAEFVKDGKNIDVVWSREPVALSAVTSVKTDRRKLFDMMGNSITADALTLTQSPIYISD